MNEWEGASYGAIAYHEKALNIRLTKLEKNHPDTAMSYNNLGGTYDGKGDYNRAIEYHEKALNIRLTKLGENHPHTAMSYNHLGKAYDHKGDYDRALAYLQQAFTIRFEKLGQEHPDTRQTLRHIEIIQQAMESVNSAPQPSQQAVLDEMYLNRAAHYNKIGLAYYDQASYDNAVEHFQMALDIYIDLLGQGHPNTEHTRHNIIQSQQAMKRNARSASAEDCYCVVM